MLLCSSRANPLHWLSEPALALHPITDHAQRRHSERQELSSRQRATPRHVIMRPYVGRCRDDPTRLVACPGPNNALPAPYVRSTIMKLSLAYRKYLLRCRMYDTGKASPPAYQPPPLEESGPRSHFVLPTEVRVSTDQVGPSTVRFKLLPCNVSNWESACSHTVPVLHLLHVPAGTVAHRQ